MADPEWLFLAREAQAIAQTGLTYCSNDYDRERYEQLRHLAARMVALHGDVSPRRIEALFARESGYATPKIDVRTALFDSGGRLLMVRERMDSDRWTLPGGWADVTDTPAGNALRELREESGYEGEIVKLAAVWDRAKQGHAPDFFACAKLFFVARLTGGAARPSIETSEVAWFARDAIPADLSTGRVLPGQIARMFEHHAHPELPTDFD
ncbi:NUDIX hydrolase [Acidomonas methanolica]|uniref:Phosphohydrolase n=1 Tax=Acidomonas methanolica NBRC 104435 TaxID=1231351 RepID=A0A023D2E1_ACIMT|nr:NUDIX hydrolase N-terminal domain-containing protein [Acidomonas methanolica]MBU2655175.1 NUDIX hydrolase N-terminal domain-containing protein [Acidomonas methanolica]TCS24702.1 ADP-ribose pyrophosphatase YjhB (NUDIX family) [Acidomonas methanolica]GAJ28229.1 phosphohydrolase [Acidomonas methanolica NBRC 104435]GBQ51939.1 phosphohydrolase [Acidomonas methanolica]GEK98778.1 putative ADP-ribose pyrophosphatase YjhB [Acidomonas methanolica NBRC 104435]